MLLLFHSLYVTNNLRTASQFSIIVVRGYAAQTEWGFELLLARGRAAKPGHPPPGGARQAKQAQVSQAGQASTGKPGRPSTKTISGPDAL